MGIFRGYVPMKQMNKRFPRLNEIWNLWGHIMFICNWYLIILGKSSDFDDLSAFSRDI